MPRKLAPLSPTRWPLDMNARPRSLHMGLSTHGDPRYETWVLPRLWCLHLYRYHATWRVNGETFELRPATMSLAPPGAKLEYFYRGPSTHFFVHFSLEDTGQATHGIAPLVGVGVAVVYLENMLGAALDCMSRGELARAEIKVWDVLGEMAALSAQADAGQKVSDPLVAQACVLIAARIEEPLLIKDLAREIGVSHNHLNRLFVRDLGKSAGVFMREQRLERARHLLCDSTIPVGVVAARVGIPDPHEFNKVIRRHFGMAPKFLRAQAQNEVTRTACETGWVAGRRCGGLKNTTRNLRH